MAYGPKPKAVLDRIAAKTDRRGEHECWEWMGAKCRRGYGIVRLSNPRRISLVTRVVMGPVPKGMYVMHKCDNPPCVNPAHLRVGTPSENIQDMLSKGRGLVGVPKSLESRMRMSIAAKRRCHGYRADE